jgi:16S rRNA (cytosine967-C5)-methyltransferase
LSAAAKEAAGLPARAAAIHLLSQVLRKAKPLDTQLEALAALPPRDAGFARAVASETLRRFGQLEAAIRVCVPKPLPPHKTGAAMEILLAGACELLFLDVAPHAAVDAANRLAQKDAKAVHFKALINAVLRRLAREGKQILAAQDAPRLNTPDWLWQSWCAAYGEDSARAIAAANGAQAPLDIVLKNADAIAPDGERLFGNALRLGAAARVEDLPGFAEGHWWVQDAAATLPVHLLGDVRGQRVIELCAAPGGKTMQLAAAGADVTSVELEARRLTLIEENLARTGLSAQLVAADARDWTPDAPAPFVLLDAPCTATGTIRRHPDLPWIKSASDVTACVQTAYELLDAAAAMVAPGGLLVFAVCSLEREEGVEQIENFLRAHPEFSREKIAPADLFTQAQWISEEGDLRTLPCHLGDKGGIDGFYAARLRRAL